tara:strand:- start:278 stop:592 length:315 start_codon:yes stop_codon:yes gene_type:complete
MENQRQFIEVGKVYLVKEGDRFVSVEWAMENVPSRTAAAELIDFAKRCADNSTWVYNTISRVQEGGEDAQTQSTGDPSGDIDKQGIGQTEQAVSDQGDTTNNNA